MAAPGKRIEGLHRFSNLLGCHLLLHPIALQVLDRALDLQAQSGRIVPKERVGAVGE